MPRQKKRKAKVKRPVRKPAVLGALIHDALPKNRHMGTSLARLAEFDCKKLVILCGVSQRQVERICKRQFCCSPQAWLDKQRMALSKQLLASNPIGVVSDLLRFKRISHFHRCFHKAYGMSPREFLGLPKGIRGPDLIPNNRKY